MSGQTLREVLVKIALEMDTKGFKPPDFASWQKDFDKAAASGKKAAESAEQVAEAEKVSHGGESGRVSGHAAMDRRHSRRHGYLYGCSGRLQGDDRIQACGGGGHGRGDGSGNGPCHGSRSIGGCRRNGRGR